MEENIKRSLKQMAKMVSEMSDLVYQGLMENDAHYLDSALNKERIVDDIERKLMEEIFNLNKTDVEDKKRDFVLLAQAAENLERMGDELRYLMERIEIKIAEKLYFSDIGIKQYQEVFEKMRLSVSLITKFITEDKTEVLNQVLKNGEEIKKMIERYRQEHVERLTKGLCQPRAANMFFDMLDFTGNVARHCTNIARIYKE